MPTYSTDFLEVDDQKGHGRHRSHSGGRLDFLEQQERWERREQRMQMKRYHDSKHSSVSASQIPQGFPSSGRLSVPTYEPGHRRVRSQEQIIEKPAEPVKTYNEPVRNYSVREQKPSYDLSDDVPLPSQFLVRQSTWRPKKGPGIKVEVHNPDRQSSATSKQTPRRSPSVSPHSPGARPQLQYQFATLQSKLAQIEACCGPHLHVEAANPRDLTFSKIADEVKGHAFQLRVWIHVANLDDLSRIDKEKRQIVEHAAHTLDRLIERVSDLNDACSQARPKDLKMELLPDFDDEDEYGSYDDDDEDYDDVKDVTESLGFIIQSYLQSIRLQLQTLGRLTRSLQEATPDAKDEVIAVEALQKDVERFFGSSEALRRYSIDERFAGGKALEEARYTVNSR